MTNITRNIENFDLFSVNGYSWNHDFPISLIVTAPDGTGYVDTDITVAEAKQLRKALKEAIASIEQNDN
jgi:hypothetical protein